MKMKVFLLTIALFQLFFSVITKADDEDVFKCRSGLDTAYTGYITGIAMGYHGGSNNKVTRIILMFTTDKNTPAKGVMTQSNYNDPGGPGFLSLLQTALLTGQKVSIVCNGNWVQGIWLGEGADVSSVPKGLP
ncbi:hypothetical protein [Xenorhabdus sp. KK7.4]|uniref:hypothetical protein n=1 Tax=Xenorhabdus sp. KK7.4 TaxID=1851572 RepID=UPI000C03C84F|nr:hypothetical protein [Xenorhabdus sp. KK7.4]PHM51637.1 hypothetical protein Xekk_03573 [Xenorhabdus sp. KK7.4]